LIEKVYIVGLTGPTGSGKSEVSRVFVGRHIPVIDADELARRVVEKGSPCLEKLVHEFSEDILCDDGSLNRRQLAKRAFATPEDTQLLNDITHPYIIDLTKRILMQLEQVHEPVAVIDAPLLFESGMDSVCDLTVAVVAPYERRLRRIRERDDLTEKQATSRMAAQQDEEFYVSHANYVLRNDTGLDELREHAEELVCRIKEWANG
jgi:dephospho-CoA kinase